MKGAEEMKVTIKKEDLSWGFLGPIGFAALEIIAAMFFATDRAIPAIVIAGAGIVWIALSFRIVNPVFAGLVLKLGARIVESEVVWHYRLVDGEKVDILEDEFTSPDFNKNAPDVKSEVVLVNYLIKKEGWIFICPIIETIVEVSLRQQQREINAQEKKESEEDFKKNAESITTAEGVNIFPEIFYSYRVVDPGKVFELGEGIDAQGNSPFLNDMLHNLIMGGARGVLAKMELTKILTRMTEDDRGNVITVGEKIRFDILNTANFEKLGTELLIIRIEDIKFTKEAQDVLDALEDVKKQEFERQSQVVEADARLQVQQRDSETLVIKSNAELVDAQNKARAENAKIAAFVGKKIDETTTVDDGKAYAQYQIGLQVAKSLETGTKVIVPAGDMSKTVAGLVNVYEASKPGV